MDRSFPHPISILMPICNEQAVVVSLVEEWDQEVIQYLPSGSELVFDDGASTDGTLNTLDELQKKYPYIRVLRSKREGFAPAARRLYQEARCPYVFFTDSDGQYVPSEFWKVVEAQKGYDIGHGAKVGRKDPLIRVVGSAVFNRITIMLCGTHVPDINSAFRLFPKRIADELVPQVHCMPTLLNAELTLRCIHAGYTVNSVGVMHRPREHGVSRGLPPAKFLKECWRAFKGLLELRRELRASPRAAGRLATAQGDKPRN
jgi:glycosyltransferase involved in cell wall biosynthesis